MKGNDNSLLRVALVSAVTTIAVLLVFAVVGGGIYYFAFRDVPLAQNVEKPETLSDKLKRAERTLGLSSTDASKITAISYNTWRHAGPLYPRPGEPPGFVASSKVEFRRNLVATLLRQKNYDRDEPDELSSSTANLTEDQFQKLASICAEYDLVNEQDATGNISEAGTHLNIEYDGKTKKLVTSNTGQNSAGLSALLNAIAELQNNIAWTRS